MPDASASRVGRPHASSRRILSEAACELFLERGYAETAVADITARAGVSRSSFFNYFSSKDDVVWAGFDARLDAAATRLTDRSVPVSDALAGVADGYDADSLALAIANADAMGLRDVLARDRAIRQGSLAQVVSARLRSDGVPSLESEVRAAAVAGAVLAAVWAWADAGAGRTALPAVLESALALALGG